MDKYKDQENERRDNDRKQEQGRTPNQGEDQFRNETGNAQNRPRGNAQDLEQNWRHMENSYRQRYPNLTDEDVNYRSGEFDNMTQRIARRTNRTRQEVENDIRNWNDR